MIDEMITCIKCGCFMSHGSSNVSSICTDCVGEEVDSLSTDDLVAMAKVGIDALVDEVTGYEKVRPAHDLRERHQYYKGDR